MKILLLFLGLIMCAFNANTQINFDSLWTVWEDESQQDTSRLQAMNIIAWNQYLFSNPDTAFLLAQEMHDLALEKELPKMQAQALNIQGVSFWIKGEYEKAIEYYKKNLNVYIETDNQLGIATSLNNMGLVYRDRGDLKNAVEHFLKSVRISEGIDNKYGIASATNNAAMVYYSMKDYKAALNYFGESKSIYEELKLEKGIATNILSDRLKKLEQNGIIESKVYEKLKTKKEYTLTQKGRHLIPVLLEMIAWSAQYRDNLAIPDGFLEKMKTERHSVISAVESKLD